jgi:hypothetical protein
MTLKHALDAFAGAEVAGQLLDTAGGRPGVAAGHADVVPADRRRGTT